jgi:NADH-quinone oxidoreductase subunit M
MIEIPALTSLPVLSVLVWAPFAGAIGIATVGRGRAFPGRLLAVLFSSVSLAAATLLFLGFDRMRDFRELGAWLPALGVSYELALDRMGSALALWISLLTPLAILYERPEELDRGRIARLLLVETALLGLLAARDAVLFLAFLGAGLTLFTLMPRDTSMRTFFFFQSAGASLALGFAVVCFHLTLVQNGQPSSEIARFTALVTFPDFDRNMFLLGASATALLAPLFLFSAWLRDSVEGLEGGGRLLLLGGWSIAGPLILIRFVLPAFARGALEAAAPVCAIGALGTIYAGAVPSRGRAGDWWVPLLVGFQGLLVLGLLSSDREAVGSGKLAVIHVALGMTALALLRGSRESSTPPATFRSKFLAGAVVAGLLALPSPSGLPIWWVILRAAFASFPTAAILAGLGTIAMATRLVLRLPAMARGAAEPKNALLLLPLLAGWLLLAAAPHRFVEAVVPPAEETAVEEEPE